MSIWHSRDNNSTVARLANGKAYEAKVRQTMVSEVPSTDSSGGAQVLENSSRRPKNLAIFHRRTLRALLGLGPDPTSTLGDEAEVRRLGKAELGPYAYEERMPSQLRALLEDEDTTQGAQAGSLIEALGRLCDQDKSVEAAYLCHPAVQPITKSKNEGNFCGYRNIQMMVSYIIGAKVQGSKHFSHGLPSVLALQDMIEDAWDQGINSDGRVETGGIRGTRKYIGTPEAQALFRSLGIGCRVATHPDTVAASPPWTQLLGYVKQYFLASSPNATPSTKIHQTNLPPIYLQQPRHSLTVVGLETRVDGTFNLLVFDPALCLSRCMAMALGYPERGKDTLLKSRQTRALLKQFRRGERQLHRHKNFETLVLTSLA